MKSESFLALHRQQSNYHIITTFLGLQYVLSMQGQKALGFKMPQLWVMKS